MKNKDSEKEDKKLELIDAMNEKANQLCNLMTEYYKLAKKIPSITLEKNEIRTAIGTLVTINAKVEIQEDPFEDGIKDEQDCID